jgi:hypothetical protein
MIFTVTMKDPDGVHHSTAMLPNKMTVARAIQKWFEYEEYLTVEVDTDAGTCTVLKPRRD